jgi:hypothetical protein
MEIGDRDHHRLCDAPDHIDVIAEYCQIEHPVCGMSLLYDLGIYERSCLPHGTDPSCPVSGTRAGGAAAPAASQGAGVCCSAFKESRSITSLRPATVRRAFWGVLSGLPPGELCLAPWRFHSKADQKNTDPTNPGPAGTGGLDRSSRACQVGGGAEPQLLLGST